MSVRVVREDHIEYGGWSIFELIRPDLGTINELQSAYIQFGLEEHLPQELIEICSHYSNCYNGKYSDKFGESRTHARSRTVYYESIKGTPEEKHFKLTTLKIINE
jgi:hypothetical protein